VIIQEVGAVIDRCDCLCLSSDGCHGTPLMDIGSPHSCLLHHGDRRIHSEKNDEQEMPIRKH
jgi:hypothetical protein